MNLTVLRAALRGLSAYRPLLEAPVLKSALRFLDAAVQKDGEAALEAAAERAFVRELEGGCSSPVAAHARVCGDSCRLRGLYYDEQSGEYSIGERTFNIEENDPAQAARTGRELAHELRDRYAGKS